MGGNSSGLKMQTAMGKHKLQATHLVAGEAKSVTSNFWIPQGLGLDFL